MRRSSKEQFIELPPGECDRYMLFRILPKLGNDQARLVFFAGAAVCGEKVVSLFRYSQLDHTGQAFSIRPGLVVEGQLFGGRTAKVLIERLRFMLGLVLLHPHMQAAVGRFLCQSEEIRNINIDMDVVGVPVTRRPSLIVGHKLQMDFVQVEAVVFHFHKAVAGVFTDDLILIIRCCLVFQPWPPPIS